MRYIVEADSDSSAEVFEAGSEQFANEPLFRGPLPCDDLARFRLIDDGVEVDAASAWDAAYHYASLWAPRGVRRVTPDLAFTRYDRYFTGAGRPGGDGPPDRRWGLAQVHAPKVWELKARPGRSSTGADVRVAHPDTGYTLHPELDAVFDRERDRDFMNGDEDARDPLGKGQTGHGTSTGSVIAGSREGPIAGVAPDATIVPIRVMKDVWHIRDSRVAQGVAYAATPEADCHVISMSLGGVGFEYLHEAIRCAIDRGVLVMAAAGNYVRRVVAPATYPEVIAVAASRYDRKPWFHSSRGPKVAVTAPGHEVWVASFEERRPQTHRVWPHDGTSFSVAHVAGAAALWLGYHGRDELIERYGLGNLQRAFLSHLTDTADPPTGWDTGKFGTGIVNAFDLVTRDLVPETMFESLDWPIDPIKDATEALADDIGLSRADSSSFSEELRYLMVEYGDVAEDGMLDQDAGRALVVTRGSRRLLKAIGS